MNFPIISDSERLRKLKIPDGVLNVVIDTDTYNEIDDQFALVHALLSPERLNVEAIYAAPFHNERSDSPLDGMEKSYSEIHKLLLKLKKEIKRGFVLKGSRGYIKNDLVPIVSDAAEDLINRANTHKADDPLFVISIGAITNIASALLIEPEIIKKLVVIWLGGHALHWKDTAEFNLRQDVAAANTILNSGVPLVLIPCMGVTSHLHTTTAEIYSYVKGKGICGDYLYEIFSGYEKNHKGWSKVIWDLSATAFLINDEWLPSEMINCPLLTKNLIWNIDQSRHYIRYVYHVHRDPIFRDLFLKLETHQIT